MILFSATLFCNSCLGFLRSMRLRRDRDLVRAAIENEPCALRYAVRNLRADRELVLYAVSKDKRALKFVAYALRKDPEVQNFSYETCIFEIMLPA